MGIKFNEKEITRYGKLRANGFTKEEAIEALLIDRKLMKKKRISKHNNLSKLQKILG